jgi:hypothetical protein
LTQARFQPKAERFFQGANPRLIYRLARTGTASLYKRQAVLKITTKILPEKNGLAFIASDVPSANSLLKKRLQVRFGVHAALIGDSIAAHESKQ